jgi:hypothetical protein
MRYFGIKNSRNDKINHFYNCTYLCWLHFIGVDQEVTEGDLDLEIEKGHQENLDQNHEKEVKIENVPEHPKKVVGVVRVLEGM